MTQTPEGARKARETLINKYGSYEAYKEYMNGLSSKGGKVKNPTKGFGGISPERRAELGHRGGTISRRGKAKKNVTS